MPPPLTQSRAAASKVLIVDDDPGQRSLLDSFLKSQGFATVVVSYGEEALAALRAQDIAMMISDVRMPGISGLETLRRARQEHAVLPVLLVTAYADIRDAVVAMRDVRSPIPASATPVSCSTVSAILMSAARLSTDAC